MRAFFDHENNVKGRDVSAIRINCLLLLLMLLCSQAWAASDTANQVGWKLVSDRDGIQVYVRPSNDNSRLKTFRGVTVVKLADQYTIAALLNDYASYSKWLHFVDSATEISRTSPVLRYLRFTTLLPWPLSDRDAVLEARVVQTHPSPLSDVSIYLDGRPGLVPEVPGYVRFPEMRGIFRVRALEQPDMLEVTYQLTLDPGGYIPIWLTNILLRDAPYFTLLRLRQMVKDPKYHDKYYDYLDLLGPGRPANAHPQVMQPPTP